MNHKFDNKFNSDVFLDFRSDTVTEMSTEMRTAMSYAVTGDMLYNDDKNIVQLETILSELFNMECIWTPSCTMSNLIGLLMAKKSYGYEIIVGQTSHINTFERKNATYFGGIAYKVLNDEGGFMNLEDIEKVYVEENEFFPKIVAIALENTHNLAGGTAFTPQYLYSVVNWAKSRGMKVHLDGARIFNASVALDAKLSDWSLNGDGVDSISLSLSKGLGTPAGGALLVRGRKEKMRAKYIRKSLGGTMHTGAGYLAAAACSQLNKGYEDGIKYQLEQDHNLTKYFFSELKKLQEYKVLNKVQTNILYLNHSKIMSTELVKLLKEKGILCICISESGISIQNDKLNLQMNNTPIRFVIHRGILKKNIDFVLSVLRSLTFSKSSSSESLRSVGE